MCIRSNGGPPSSRSRIANPGGQLASHAVEGRVRVQIHILRVAPEQGRLDVDTEQTVAVYPAPTGAPGALPGPTSLALPAWDQRLHSHPIAPPHAPASRSSFPISVDDAQRLVPGDRWATRPAHLVEAAVVLLDVAAADAAQLHAQHRLVGSDSRALELVNLESPRSALLDCGLVKLSSDRLSSEGAVSPLTIL